MLTLEKPQPHYLLYVQGFWNKQSDGFCISENRPIGVIGIIECFFPIYGADVSSLIRREYYHPYVVRTKLRIPLSLCYKTVIGIIISSCFFTYHIGNPHICVPIMMEIVTTSFSGIFENHNKLAGTSNRGVVTIVEVVPL